MANETDGNLAVLSRQADVVDISAGSALEMKRNLDELKTKLQLVQQFIKEVMVEGQDYGTIPGTDKPTLLNPGADKLSFLYGYARHIASKEEHKDFATGHYDATVRVQMIHKGTGIVVGEGEGSCSTHESKYRYRWAYESQLPRGIDKTALQSQTFKSKKPGDSREFTKYRVENPDLYDIWNTVLKMAIKRAYVAAALTSTGLSGVFNQNEEEFEAWLEGQEADGNGKERLTKVKPNAQPGDEKAPEFDPYSVDGGAGGDKPARGANDISEAQEGKIIGDAKRKGVDTEGIKALVVYTKKKPLSKLTKAEASTVIDFIGKTEQAELQALVAKALAAPPQFSPEELGDK
jgi:hypothetical protein